MEVAENHIGFLMKWAQKAHLSKYYPQWEYGEILSEAYIRADFLLRNKFDPEKGRPTTFLGVCLRTDLTHVYQRQLGNYIRWEPKPSGKGRRIKWVPKIPTRQTAAPEGFSDCLTEVELSVDEMPLKGREKIIVEKISEGWSYIDIAAVLGVSRSRVGQILRDDIVEKITPFLERELDIELVDKPDP